MTAAERPPGLLLVVSSPSGAGKTTLSRRLMAEHPALRFSVSYTTRPRRTGERDGIDYHFASEAQFDEMVAAGAFVEWSFVHGRRYGTAVQAVRGALDGGQHLLLDIDYQGAQKIVDQFAAEACLVYILPPSLQILAERLRARATDAPAVIDQRLRKARQELEHYRLYNYLVVNRDVDPAYAELAAIYHFERARAGGPAAAPDEAQLARSCDCAARAHLAEALLSSPPDGEPVGSP